MTLLSIKSCRSKKHGFTLIELLIVITIIGLLATIGMVSLNASRVKARDAKRKVDLKQLSTTTELRFSTTNVHPASAGWFTNPGHGGLDAALTPTYIAGVPDDPLNIYPNIYMYWRKDTTYDCLPGGQPEKFGYYARLENPSPEDLATIVDAFDMCVKNNWGMNYKYGN